ncbi:LOW QUALITY PROTEIN: ovochymase-1 [Phoenicopterus ruber ruber]
MAGAGLLLLLVSLLVPCGLKCGVHPTDLKSPKDVLLLGFFSQITGGREPVPGGQPWQVFLKLGCFHFCDGGLVEDVVITALHYVVNPEQKPLKSLVVTVGERHLQLAGRQEQSIPVSLVTIHPAFNRLHYTDCDVALLCLQHPAQYGDEVQPICLPHRDEAFQAGTLCGWGKVSLVVGLQATGDSEGPLACLRTGGPWTLASVVSWGVGCARGWGYPQEKHHGLGLTRRLLPGKSCRDVFPAPVLAESDQVTVVFVCDGSNAGHSFKLTFMAPHKDSGAGLGCGSVAMLVEEGKIDTANYPGLYPGNMKCHWLIEAPAEYVVKLELEDFAAELNLGCIYDAVTVHGDEEENQLANLCGFSTTKLVLSPGNTMLVHFENDGKNSFKGCTHFLLGAVTEITPQWLFKHVSGAEEACPHCWPWHAALKLLGDYQGDGAVISPTWLLTAAHCVQLSNKPLPRTAGDHDRALRESTKQVRQVKTIVVHPHFDMLSYDSNIALVQLDVPLENNAAVRPVCLSNSTETLSSSFLCTVPNLEFISQADGSARRLQQTQVPVLENEICERNYYFSHPGGITARILCAGFVSVGGQDSCQGGSGGPLVGSKENGPFALYGIVSWAVGCASPKKPGVSSRARIFLDWIRLPMKVAAAAVQCCSHRSTFLRRQLFLISLLDLKDFYPAEGLSSPPLCSQHPMQGMAKIIVKYLSITSSLSCQEEFLGIYEESQRGRKVLGCTDVILTDQEGMIQSLGYPVRYANATSCHWRIVAPLKSIIWLEVPDFWTERNLSCPGFDLIPVATTEITSPNYPGIYPDMLNCTWTIYSTSGNRLKAVLKDFVTEDARDCISNLGGQKKSFSMFSSSSFLNPHFKTDESVGYRGFKILPEELHQQPTQSELEGSSRYPSSEGHHFCGGFQTDEKWVLRAAHCNFRQNSAGEKCLLPNVKDVNPMLVKAVHTHCGFGGFPFRKDLALLELQKPIEPGTA